MKILKRILELEKRYRTLARSWWEQGWTSHFNILFTTAIAGPYILWFMFSASPTWYYIITFVFGNILMFGREFYNKRNGGIFDWKDIAAGYIGYTAGTIVSLISNTMGLPAFLNLQ